MYYFIVIFTLFFAHTMQSSEAAQSTSQSDTSKSSLRRPSADPDRPLLATFTAFAEDTEKQSPSKDTEKQSPSDRKSANATPSAELRRTALATLYISRKRRESDFKQRKSVLFDCPLALSVIDSNDPNDSRRPSALDDLFLKSSNEAYSSEKTTSTPEKK